MPGDGPPTQGLSRPRAILERIGPAHLIVVLALLVVGFDVLFFPFYADDFHFLDVARHRPLLELISGQYGIWPWYRPLSRELFFVLLTHVGPFGPLLGHAIEAAAVMFAALLIYRIATPLTSALAGSISAILFIVYEETKMLASWASGFQDLLALVLALGAVFCMQRARYRPALVLAAMAPLSKEPMFIVYPVLLLYLWLFVPRREGRPSVRAVALSALVPLSIHAVARATWSYSTVLDGGNASRGQLRSVLLQFVRFFLGGDAAPTAGSILTAVAAGGVAWLCIRRAFPTGGASRSGRTMRALSWFAGAALLGILPVVAGSLLFGYGYAYQAMPAVPWVCMLLGAALSMAPGAFVRMGVPLLVFWNTLGLAVVQPNLDTLPAWQTASFTWSDALRFAAVTRRFDDDLHVLLADRPESLMVLFENMPPRTFMQTEDGPAVRELLGDPTLRSYWGTEAHWISDRRSVSILAFDYDSLHLRHVVWSRPEALHRASNAIIAGRGAVAASIIRFALPPGQAEPARSHLMAAAILIDHGPEAFARELGRLGLGDTLSPPVTLARDLAGDDDGLTRAQQGILDRPLTAASYVALADSFASRGVDQGTAFGLRLALALDPGLWPERMRLVDLMFAMGGAKEAVAELSSIATSVQAGPYAERARARLAALRAAPTAPPPATP